jgi:MYXO-CTERM domain-containing protein
MPFDVVAGPAVTYRAAGLAANVAAGVPSAVVLTALDAHGNVATGYTGTAALTSTDDAIEVPASVVFTAGVGASAEVVFHTLGVHGLTATDTTDAAVTASFDTNVTMGEAPTVTVLSPSSGDGVGGMVTIRAEGTVVATSTLVSLEILVDGSVVGTSDTSPAEATWDAMSMPIGSSHTITARITDDAGNVVVSQPVVVTISEAPDGCGCRSGRGASGPGPATAIAAGLVLLAVLRRRRRSTVTSR